MSDGKVVFDITGNLSGINSALSNATNAISRQTAKWTVLGQTAMNALTSAGRVAFNTVKDLAANAFEYNAQMETYEVNFKTLLGSAEAAQVKMAELKEYAAKTPFAFTDLAEATQTMLAFDLSSEEASLALKHIGDISLGDANKLKSLTLAFSQVSSAGKLAGQDLLQMINAGFNPLQVIAEKTGASYADLKAVMSGEKTSEDFQLRMEAARKEVEELGVNASESAIMLTQIGKDGMISADMVAAAMRIATSEGGAFYKALESASETAKGQIATIQDSWDMLTGKVTGGVFDKMSTELFPKVIGWLDELNAAYDENGFAGLKEAGGGIFEEIGELALNTGSSIIAQLYNGITGDTKSGEEIKAYLSGLWTDSSAALTTFTDGAKNILSTIWTSITGQEATAGNIITTIGGLFDAGITAANDLLSIAGGYMTKISTAIGDDALGTGEKIAKIFTAGKDAMQELINAAADFGVNFYNALTGENLSSEGFKEEVAKWFGTDGEAYVEQLTQTQVAEAAERTPSKHQGKYAGVDEDTQDELLNLAYMAISDRSKTLDHFMKTYRWDFSEQFVESGMLQQFQADLSEALQDADLSIEDIEAWFEDAQGQLQSQLDNTHLSVGVRASLTGVMGLVSQTLNGLTGVGHASGGMFTSATRFLGADGMHTFGESGTEVLLPLDALWRKMGMMFDSSFASNLDWLQYSVMPQLPAATPAAGRDDDLPEAIAAAVREALKDLKIEMDKRTVGKMLVPVISKDIADDVNGRKWTA